MRQRALERDAEHKERLQQARARLRLRLHWRPVTFGVPLGEEPGATICAPAVPATSSTAVASTLVASTQFVVAPQQAPTVVRYPNGTYVQLPAPAGGLQPPGQPARPFLAAPPGFPAGSYVPAAGGVQFQGPQLIYHPALPAIPQGAQAPSQPGGSSASSSSGDGSSSSGSGSESGSESSSDDGWDGWPSYLLRVGVSFLERLDCPGTDATTRFYVVCDASPVVSADCTNARESQPGVTRLTSRKRYPLSDATAKHIERVAKTMSATDNLTRKIGLLLQRGVPIDTVADVLNVDFATVRRLKDDAMVEMNGRRDVILDEAFVYMLRDPEATELKLEIFAEAPKQKPVSHGIVTMKVGALLHCKDMAEEVKRLPLQRLEKPPGGRKEDAVLRPDKFARISAQCQLWPVVTCITPHELRAKAAAQASETLAQQEAGKSMVIAIWVYSASDLRNVDMFGGKSDPYCVVKFVSGQKAEKLFQTKVIDNDPDPVWNHPREDVKWGGEREIRFEVYDKDFCCMGDKLGEASLTWEQCRRGIYTDLDLGEDNGTLRVKVAPMHGDVPVEVPFTKPRPSPLLHIWVLAAEGLKGTSSLSGSSDVYVVCNFGSKRVFRTPAVHTDACTTWDHGPEEMVLAQQGELKFEVKDKKMMGSHKVGVAKLSTEMCLRGFQGPLQLGKGKGSLSVKVVPLPPLDETVSVPLEVTVLSARNLRNADMFGGKSDPYVMCKLKGKLKFKTAIIWDDENPVWNHGPEELMMRGEPELRFEVYDKDPFCQGDLLGHAAVERRLCLRGFDGHLDLGKGNGTLHVRVHPADSPVTSPGGPEPAKAEAQEGAEAEAGEAPRETELERQVIAAATAVAELLKKVSTIVANLIMTHIPKCGA